MDAILSLDQPEERFVGVRPALVTYHPRDSVPDVIRHFHRRDVLGLEIEPSQNLVPVHGSPVSQTVRGAGRMRPRNVCKPRDKLSRNCLPHECGAAVSGED